MLTFGDIDENFELEGSLLEKLTRKNNNVYIAHLLDKKLMFEFVKKRISMKKLWVKKAKAMDLLLRRFTGPLLW